MATTYRAEVTDAVTLGIVLQQARLAAGQSQRQLADQLGISQRYVWEMESGKPSIFTERLFRSLRVLGIRLSAEFDDENPPEFSPSGSRL